MGFFEPMPMSSTVLAGILPVDPSLAVFVLLTALAVSALGISLAATPPSALLRRVKITRKTAVRHATPASA